jgi:UDP-GlcNAc:undecaprenyl-phosphate GlcNAc-1-phosphate transferase
VSGGITWRTKISGQIIIAAITVFGFGISIAVFDWLWLNALVSIFFLVYITNSFNLMDNMDGLSAGIASIAGFFFFLLAFQQRQYDLALFSIVFAASTFGFLKYNFSPASIFMGDLGSMFLGYTLGCIAIRLQVAEISTWQIMIYHANFAKYPIYWTLKHLVTSAIPLLVVAVPLFDTMLVAVLRSLHGLKISTPGKDHSSHRLTKVKGWIQRKIDKFIVLFIRTTGRRKKSQHHILRGMAQTRAVLILYACSAILGLVALAIPSLTLKSGLFVFIIVIVIAGISIKKFNEVVVYQVLTGK